MVYSALHSVLNIEVEKEHVVDNYSVPDLVRPWALLKPTSRLIDELRYNVFGLDSMYKILQEIFSEYIVFRCLHNYSKICYFVHWENN